MKSFIFIFIILCSGGLLCSEKFWRSVLPKPTQKSYDKWRAESIAEKRDDFIDPYDMFYNPHGYGKK